MWKTPSDGSFHLGGRVRTVLLQVLPALGLLAFAIASPAATFDYFPAPFDVTPAATGWQDVDVSAYVPVGATGVILQYVETSGLDWDYGVRMKGSTDPFYPSAAKASFQGFLMTGLDPGRVFQVYSGSLSVKTYLVGYTMGGVTFFTNRIDKSTATTGSFVDVSIAADTGTATAIGAIFHVQNTSGASVDYAVRKKGSTDSRLFGLRADNANLVLIGVDAVETAQQQIASTALDLYLVGYVTYGAVFFTNGIDKSTTTAGSYVGVDLTADLGVGVANGAFLEIHNDAGTRRLTAVRPGGATYDYYSDMQHQFALVGLDAGDVFQQKIENTQMKVFLTGYSLGASTSSFRVKSGSYTGTGLARSITGLGFKPDVVIVDGVGGGADSSIKTSSMAGADSKQLDNAAALDTSHIVSLDADGFSLGTDPDVNQSGINYYWVAFREAPGIMKVGTYASTGAAQNVSGVGFTPAYVVVLSPNAARPVQRTDEMPAGFSLTFEGAGFNNAILNMQPNGFGLGTNSSVAQAATTFHYVAWDRKAGQIAVSNYAGNKADNRNVTGLGFQPEYVIVNRSSDVGSSGGSAQGNAPAHKTAASGVNTDSSTLFGGNTAEADNIQALQSDGFQVGTHCRVNGDGTCNVPAPVAYYWAAFGPRTPQTYYRSIGTASDLTNEGTITVTADSTIVTKTGGLGWKAENRGRGDRLTAGGNDYVILSVDSDDQLTLASPAVASFTGSTYTIARQFTTLQAWEDCISLAVACTYFPVSSANLVADDRREVGIAYHDSVFTLSSSVVINGSTTDSTHTITLTVDQGNRHDGIPGAGVRVDANLGPNEIQVRDENVTLEWLEMYGLRAANNMALVRVIGPSLANVLLQNLLLHDYYEPTASTDQTAIRLSGSAGKTVTVRNSMIWDGDRDGIRADELGDILIIENCSVDDIRDTSARGVYAEDTPGVVVRNTIVTRSGTNFAVGTGSFDATLSTHNVADSGTIPGGSALVAAAADLFVAPGSDLHLKPGAAAIDSGVSLAPSFYNDIDAAARPSGTQWDRGADEFGATTAVKLESFAAFPGDSEVLLEWRTASELSNLGFHLYRALSDTGPWTRLTTTLIPGLGSSPAGAAYSYQDSGLVNGVTYFYRLEDVESTGKTALHGPVSAKPFAGAESHSAAGSGGASLISYGRPEGNGLREISRNSSGVVLELTTEGFSAEPQEDGSVRLEIPGFEALEGNPSVPVLRPWIEVDSARGVAISRIEEISVDTIGLRPSGAAETELVASPRGVVSARRRRARGSALTAGLVPGNAARLLEVGYQGDSKKARLELAPLRWDGSRGELSLAKKLIVHVSFRGRARERHREGAARVSRAVAVRLVTAKRGLHQIAYVTVFPGRRHGNGVPADSLRLSRQGRAVAFHLEPDSTRFAPGSRLYFLSEGPEENPYGSELVYELELGAGLSMEEGSAPPSGESLTSYSVTQTYEENRLYQAGLLAAEDLWLWDVLLSPVAKDFPFELRELASGPSRLTVWLQGASNSDSDPDHLVRLYMNDAFHHELAWDGKEPRRVALSLPSGALREGTNVLRIENSGDTGAPYSMVMLDRFEIVFPRKLSSEEGLLEGSFSSAGTASVSGLGAAHLLDTTEEAPRWLSGAVASLDGSFRFRAEAGRSYLAISRNAVPSPSVRPVPPIRLRKGNLAADYLVIGPEAFASEASRLLEHRRSQGLRVKFAAIEDVFSEFGFGEPRPEAIREFLSYAYHHWQAPRLRYVLLLGDATYDFKDYLKTGVRNQVPPLLVKTSYLWTASDPALAAVHGDDRLPDLAIGRLPATSSSELRILVSKILAYETGEAGLGGLLVLAADNADAAGNFPQNADEIARGPLAGRLVRRLYLHELGSAMTAEILRAFDEGASLVSYVGHGGIHLWADENVLNTSHVARLAPQPQQPLLLTMNCLNGYFHFPYFDSLAEALLKAEDRGVIAAFSPSGLSLNAPAHRFHQLLLDALFREGHERIGDAVVAAQQRYASTGAFPELLSIYHLLGDPALRLR